MSDNELTPKMPSEIDMAKIPKGLAQLLNMMKLSPEMIAYVFGRQDAIDWKLVLACAIIFGSMGAVFTFLYMNYYILIAYEIPKLLG